MGQIKKGILGGFSGKVGSVVGATWRGKDIVRSRPKASTKAPSEAQLKQRERFRVAQYFIRPLKPLLALYFGEPTGSKSRVELASSYFLKDVVFYENDDLVIDFDRVIISKGDLSPVYNLEKTTTGRTTELSWTDNSGQGSAVETDLVTVAVYNEAFGDWFLFEDIATRGDESAQINLPSYVGTANNKMYLFLHAANSNKASTSVQVL